MTMRLSNLTIYSTGIGRLNSLQTQLNRTGEQIATGRKHLTAAEDPIAAARALEVSQAQSVNDQFQTNRQYATSSLSQVESILSSVTTVMQDLQALVVAAGNAAYSNADRGSLVQEMRGKFDDLMGLANTSDGAGGFLFSGYKSTTQPFVRNTDGAQYVGAQGQRVLQVASARHIPITDSGDSIFEHNRTGNSTFETSAAAANTGTGKYTLGSVTDTTLLTKQKYELNFTVAAGVTTYDVVNTSTGATLSSGNAYVDGQPINFDGIQVAISGAPANGDKFELQPSQLQSVFSTVRDLIDLVAAPISDATGTAKLKNGLLSANANMSNALDNILMVRSEIGSNLKELDYLDISGSDLGLQYARSLSDLQALDYNKALSELAQQQFTLEAAQKSYKNVTSLSLFNFIQG
ncbi:MAG TPA: flagellar hook-associated protein FlgL [Burkholderiaceae bacterium]